MWRLVFAGASLENVWVLAIPSPEVPRPWGWRCELGTLKWSVRPAQLPQFPGSSPSSQPAPCSGCPILWPCILQPLALLSCKQDNLAARVWLCLKRRKNKNKGVSEETWPSSHCYFRLINFCFGEEVMFKTNNNRKIEVFVWKLCRAQQGLLQAE